MALVEEDGATLRFVASDGAGAEEIVGVTIPVSRGIAGWAAMSGQPIAVRDVQTDARFARDVAESTHYVPTAILAAPMLDADGEVLGVASVLDPAVDQASEWTLHVLGTLASHMALLVTATGGERRRPTTDSGGWEATYCGWSRPGNRRVSRQGSRPVSRRAHHPGGPVSPPTSGEQHSGLVGRLRPGFAGDGGRAARAGGARVGLRRESRARASGSR